MRKLTREEAVSLHRQMWNEIANLLHEGKHYTVVMEYKRQALYRLGISDALHEKPLNHCFCCEYSNQNGKVGDVGCPLCPLHWADTDRPCMNTCGHDDSPYSKFTLSLSVFRGVDYEKAEQYAREIANLPERTDV